MKCPHCGQEHDDAAKFCQNTGKPIEKQTLVCSNPMCDYREPLPFDAKYCPLCGTPLVHSDMSLFKNENHNGRIIIAYKNHDEDEDGLDSESHKDVTIFKNNEGYILYSGVVEQDSINLTLRELPIRVGNKNFINLKTGYDNYIEVSATGVRDGLNIQTIHSSNYYGNKECDGFEVLNCKDKDVFISQITKKRYDDIFDNFLINYFEVGEIIYHDIYDRYTEEKLHSRIPVTYGGVVTDDNREFKHWLHFYCAEVILLVNRYSHFCLDENEVVVDNFMYDTNWQPGYRIWSYSSRNRILTTFRYDEYEPNYEGIKIIRMRDENGKVINEINADGLFLKGNFLYNKCLAIKEKKNKKLLVYIDENGNVNEVPNIRVYGEYEDIECFFVTDNVLVVNDKDGATMLTIKGEVIFDSYRMSLLPDKLVDYYDLEIGHHGIIDSTGTTIVQPKYEAFDVLV